MSNMANKPGIYNKFSGRIEYEGTYCEVKDATFELLEDKKRFKDEINIWIEFKSGDVVSGFLSGTDIKHCNFYGDTLWYVYPPPFDKFDKAYDTITKPGRYGNFTGWVKFEGSNFYIKNGDLEIAEKGSKKITIGVGNITEGVLDKAIINDLKFDGDKANLCVWGGVELGKMEFGTMVFGRMGLGLMALGSRGIGVVAIGIMVVFMVRLGVMALGTVVFLMTAIGLMAIGKVELGEKDIGTVV